MKRYARIALPFVLSALIGAGISIKAQTGTTIQDALAVGPNSTLGKINGIVEGGDFPPVPLLGQGQSVVDIGTPLFTHKPADGHSIMGLSLGFATQVPDRINQMGLNVEMVTPSSNSADMAGALFGIYEETDYNSGGTLFVNNGGFFGSYNRGAGTMQFNTGLYAESIMGDPYQSLGSGSILNNYGLRARSGALRGRVANDYSVFVDSPYVGAGAIFDNGHFGIYINDQTAGGALPNAVALKVVKGTIDFGAGNLINIESSGSGALYFIPPTGNIGNIALNWPTTNGTFALLGQLAPTHTPSSATDAGSAGTIAWDSNFVYVCVAPNTWKRGGIASW